MVKSLCCLHNQLIDKKEGDDIPQFIATGNYAIVNRGERIMIDKNTRLYDIIYGGSHFHNLT